MIGTCIDSNTYLTQLIGKSTLLKLICCENAPTEGTVSTRSGLSVGRFHQHSAEVLEMEMSPVDYIQSKYQDKYPTNRLEEWRAVVGNYGIPKVVIRILIYLLPIHAS